MMNKMIVTIRDNEGMFEFDFEIPVELPVSDIKQKVALYVNSEKPGINLKVNDFILINEGTGRQLSDQDNFISADVITGDVLNLFMIQ